MMGLGTLSKRKKLSTFLGIASRFFTDLVLHNGVGLGVDLGIFGFLYLSET